MSQTRIRATARVRVTLEIDGGGPWGPECSVDQVHRQAAEHALSWVRRLPHGPARVVGDPVVLMVTVEEER